MKDYVEATSQSDDFFAKEWFNVHIGDLPLLFYMIQAGDSYYIDEIMSYYRATSGVDSFSTNFTLEKRLGAAKAGIRAIEKYNVFTKRRYESVCNDLINKLDLETKVLTKQYSLCINSKENRKNLKQIIGNRRWRMKIYVGGCFPRLYKLYIKHRSK